MTILGGDKKETTPKREEKNGAVWKVKILENAFHFYLDSSPETELFLEYDELKAAGKAYETKKPLNILDVLRLLETLKPDFQKMRTGRVILSRKHFGNSSGLLVEREDSGSGVFMKDATLETINFLDFHDEFLNNETKLLPEEHE